jgi:hypothetical protein
MGFIVLPLASQLLENITYCTMCGKRQYNSTLCELCCLTFPENVETHSTIKHTTIARGV